MASPPVLVGSLLWALATIISRVAASGGPVGPFLAVMPPSGAALPDRTILAPNSILNIAANATIQPSVTDFVVDGILRSTPAGANLDPSPSAGNLSLAASGLSASATPTTFSSVTRNNATATKSPKLKPAEDVGAAPAVAAAASDSYWLPAVERGQHPLAPPSYSWFRNVADFGAVGDGVADDTQAITNAIMQGNRCVLANGGCNTTSVLGAVVYFPPGNYRISAPLVLPFYTFMIGNPSTPPRIIGSSTFQGIALLDTDVYIPMENGEEYYQNQNNFYRTIENFVLDLSGMNDAVGFNQLAPPGCSNVGVHYQVAQGTRMQNVEILLHQGGHDCGIFMENGSGGFMSDISINFGAVGMIAGSQQFTFRNINFNNCVTGIMFIWDWVMTFQQVTMNAVSIAFDFRGLSGSGPNDQPMANLILLDSTFNFVPIICFFPGNDPEAAMTQVYLENIMLTDVPQDGTFVAQLANGTPLLGPLQAGVVTSWARGKRYLNITDTGASSTFATTGDILPSLNRPPELTAQNGWWFSNSKPDLRAKSFGDFLSVKSGAGAKGDGQSDDTQALANAFSAAAQSGQCVWIPMGIYVVTSTVVIPAGVPCVVGEGLPQIMGKGSTFSDPTNPIPVVQVGLPGEGGNVQLINLLFTVGGGNTGGAELVQWNAHASTPGEAGMWDCYFRVGGALGSDLQASDCPTGSVNQNCIAAATLLHVMPDAGGYFENVWAWTSDHDIDINAQTQVNVFSGRGIIFDRTDAANWCWGCAAEHSVLAQFTVYGSSLVWLGHMQTESPYYQPSPLPPSPFPLTRGSGSSISSVYESDPIFQFCGGDAGCRRAWALRIINSTQVYVYGAGFYSFFQDYDQTCVNSGKENCQDALVDLSFSEQVFIFGLATIGAQMALSPEGGIEISQADTQFFFTTEIMVYLGLAAVGSASQGGSPPLAASGGVPMSPTSAPIAAIPGCTSGVAAGSGQTFELTTACASSLVNASIDGNANSVPSPMGCPILCDLLRLLTDTCCGTGGALGVTVIIDTLPTYLLLPDSFVPNVPITDNDGITHPAGEPIGDDMGPSDSQGFIPFPPQQLPSPLDIPAGTPLGPPSALTPQGAPQSADGAGIIPIPGCTDGISPGNGVAFELNGQCVTAIGSLPNFGGPGNSGPNKNSHCPFICDIIRLITGTCCGSGGSLGVPTIIDSLPGFLLLPLSFVPNVPITDVDGITHPAGEPLSTSTGPSSSQGFVPFGPQSLPSPLSIPAGTPLGPPSALPPLGAPGTTGVPGGEDDGGDDEFSIPGLDPIPPDVSIQDDFPDINIPGLLTWMGVLYVDAAASVFGGPMVPLSGGGSTLPNSYDLYLWTCEGPTSEQTFNVGLTSQSECSSLSNQIGLPAPLLEFNICGVQKELGDEDQNGCFPVGASGGSCCPFIDEDAAACNNQAGNACIVQIQYKCTDNC